MDVPPIVITGAGLACSLGTSPEQVWQGILAMRSRAAAMPALESSLPGGTAGYQAADLPDDFAPGEPREVRYLRWVIAQALQQAQSDPAALPYQPQRCGIILGTTLHGMRSGGEFLRSGDYGKLGAFLAGSTLDRAIDGTPLAADAMTTCSACSSSLGSIALAVTLLESGQLDLVITGGYDTVSEYAYGGFNSLRLVAEGPLRPFSKNRQGMKLGEGYGVLVLERASDARRRGATARAQIAGFGESADAHHLTQPHPQGEGAAAAIRAALDRSKLGLRDIDLVAAHATGTPDNDAGESSALARVFGDDLPRVPVVGFKSHLGHTLGGAGAVELILSMLALREQTIPACANTTPDDIEFPNLNVATGSPRPAAIRATLNTSLGFGGANTCVILTPAMADQLRQAPAIVTDRPRDPARDVMISGIGIVLPGAIGAEAFVQQLKRNVGSAPSGAIAENEYLHLLNARRVRRMNDYVKLTLAATALGCTDAGVADDEAFKQSCSAILGTAHGGSSYCMAYYGQIVREGMAAANPMLFAEGVPNAAAAHLSLMLSLKGACQTVIGSRTAGLDALRLAALRIARGQWSHAIVSAAEEFVPEVNGAYAHCGLLNPAATTCGTAYGDESGFATSAAAITFVLESREHLAQRGGRSRGRVAGSASARIGRDGAVASIRQAIDALRGPQHLVGSANNTWVDRAEAAAIARRERPNETVLSSIYGHLPETFSVGPLAAIAAVLLTGHLPPLRSGAPVGHVRPATGDERPASFGVLCTGYTGTVAGVRIDCGR